MAGGLTMTLKCLLGLISIRIGRHDDWPAATPDTADVLLLLLPLLVVVVRMMMMMMAIAQAAAACTGLGSTTGCFQ